MKRQLWIIILLPFILFVDPASIYAGQAPGMRVHFIDVGQGDSILIETPLDRTILIDGGPPDAGEKVVNYIKKQKINQIDVLISTHPDIDHIGGLLKVLDSVEVGEAYDTGKLHPTKTFANYINKLRELEIPVHLAEKDVPIEVDPMIELDVWNSYHRFSTNNESSIVLKLTYGDMDMLLMSDVGKAQERQIMKDYDIQAEVIKVGHHGSKTSSSLKFLQEVSPDISILTYSKENRYGHPVKRVIENLYSVKSAIYSTAALGNIVLETDGNSMVITPEENPIQKFIRESIG
ncbi:MULTISPECIES: ComEC/Rec2 family competence protein [Oceanobacillus]|uniref:Competence protein ComE n=1 Tax=Oceanobacillus kimchii TaxID=746691 RepID=A0ABQ5TFW2_9BACI|nr:MULTISPECIES: ComEC/Rec2 family competence protein [Oceanobacillus]MBT2601368.1 MBL fold metallo-hydrolase [Oceanobacillus sp. ISL-74]MBT2653466.1 MBL fold metallo-hydrolase [Oceanobacillus sp. ISL-73]OEH53246.1 competence protein [Oceanobacillus sp. E9]GLO65345.1 competence protein ComE [Oceanobacillus kimchii]